MVVVAGNILVKDGKARSMSTDESNKLLYRRQERIGSSGQYSAEDTSPEVQWRLQVATGVEWTGVVTGAAVGIDTKTTQRCFAN